MAPLTSRTPTKRMMKTRGERVSPFSSKDDGSPPSSSVPNYMSPTMSAKAKATLTTSNTPAKDRVTPSTLGSESSKRRTQPKTPLNPDIYNTYRDDILAPVLKALIEKTNINPSEVGDIVDGSVLESGSQRASECRMAAFYAGFPRMSKSQEVAFLDNCSSGLQAVADVSAAIKAGFYDIGIGAGLESITANFRSWHSWDGSVNSRVKTMAQTQDCILPLGITSENVAHCFGMKRQEQDQAAVDSHRKAYAATASGKFKDDIIPVKRKTKHLLIFVDEGIRPGTNLADLAKLKPVFKKDGSTTAGTSSQVTDGAGAGAVLLMKRSLAMKRGLPILGVCRTFAAVGFPPAIMGIGPSVAIPTAVKAAGLEVNDIDLFEINEPQEREQLLFLREATLVMIYAILYR
ncbi:Chain A, Peroxisomal 3-Ketoacyl-Coa Thiolase [Artemisia annua]|uniref:Chain A, Peroxisomal 3-Ketoacyl-Coa Thiolase n=1 Tax=Artemisia annua TaxID=35608 RepID=A0A2U1Q2A8_ARTAN|nr:Chain A, Peroxisomal 3-Ketoacyl-Coa Thiolase [Artemisia annua]